LAGPGPGAGLMPQLATARLKAMVTRTATRRWADSDSDPGPGPVSAHMITGTAAHPGRPPGTGRRARPGVTLSELLALAQRKMHCLSRRRRRSSSRRPACRDRRRRPGAQALCQCYARAAARRRLYRRALADGRAALKGSAGVVRLGPSEAPRRADYLDPSQNTPVCEKAVMRRAARAAGTDAHWQVTCGL